MKYSVAIAAEEAAGAGKKALEGFSAVHFGDEFCQARAGSPADLKRLKRRFPDKDFVWVTPLQAGAALERTAAGIKELHGAGLCSGFAVNDLGLLKRLLSGRDKVPVSLGRVLIYNLQRSLGSPYFRELLARAGALSFEVDSPESLGWLAEYPRAGINLHLPFGYLSHARYCQQAGEFTSLCGGLAVERVRELASPVHGRVYLRGNAYFTDNREAAEKILGGRPGRAGCVVVPLALARRCGGKAGFDIRRVLRCAALT